MAKILAQILEPSVVRNEGRGGLDDQQITRTSPWGDLKDQSRANTRRPSGLNPGVHDGARDYLFGVHPESLNHDTHSAMGGGGTTSLHPSWQSYRIKQV